MSKPIVPKIPILSLCGPETFPHPQCLLITSDDVGMLGAVFDAHQISECIRNMKVRKKWYQKYIDMLNKRALEISERVAHRKKYRVTSGQFKKLKQEETSVMQLTIITQEYIKLLNVRMVEYEDLEESMLKKLHPGVPVRINRLYAQVYLQKHSLVAIFVWIGIAIFFLLLIKS